jgi:hypothetical protein
VERKQNKQNGMKRKTVSLVIASLLAALVLIYSNDSAYASGSDDPQGHDAGDDHGGHHLGETNEIAGHEMFRGHVVLTATSNAPANVRGSVELEQENEEGTVFYKVVVREFGLAAGTYSVTAVILSDGSTVTLGNLTADGARFAKADLLLPTGVSITDLGRIIVSDSQGSEVLAGDVDAAANGTMASFNANVRITPGTGAPEVKGHARLSITQRHGQQTERFLLMASRVPPNTTFNIFVDGTLVGTVTSNRKGSLVVKKLETELGALQDLRLVSETDATELLSVHF